MKSIAELEAIRKKALDEINIRSKNQTFKVIVGMATCGIAAGARPVMNSFVEEIGKRNLNVPVNITGCIGVCRLEPIADVIDEDGNKTTYVKLTPDKVKRIVTEHLANGQIVTEYTINAAEDK